MRFFLKKIIFPLGDPFFLILSANIGEMANEEENKKAFLVDKKGF